MEPDEKNERVLRDFFEAHRFELERAKRRLDELNDDLKIRIKRLDRVERLTTRVTFLMPILFFTSYIAGSRLADLLAGIVWLAVVMFRLVHSFLDERRRQHRE